MVTILAKKLTLKPPPTTTHAILQKRLLQTIDDPNNNYLALPELRCTFGNSSLVPDIATVALAQIPLNSSGEPQDYFTQAPAWPIIIQSPGQDHIQPLKSLRHCLHHGTQLAGLIDGRDRSR